MSIADLIIIPRSQVLFIFKACHLCVSQTSLHRAVPGAGRFLVTESKQVRVHMGLGKPTEDQGRCLGYLHWAKHCTLFKKYSWGHRGRPQYPSDITPIIQEAKELP